MRQNYFLSLAKKASKKSDHHSHSVGCCIAKGNRIIGVGHNMMKTHPKSPHGCWKFIHAEFMAVLNASYNVEGATVYVYRQLKSGQPALSRPCAHCWKFLTELGIKKVVYSVENSYKQEKIA